MRNGMNTHVTRREFLGTTGTVATGVGLALAAGSAARAASANDKVVMALIGCGGMGRGNMGAFLKHPEVEVAAVCDVDQTHADEAAQDVVRAGRAAPKTYKDFRHVLERKELDAVIIGTPDHWHALPFIAACEAGKDIYCEKPISHSLVEARAMLGAARHFKRVVQIGTWQRSVKHFQEAVDYVHSGKLGQVCVCRAWCVTAFGGWLKGLGHEQPQTPPASLDWDFWLGPAARTPYTPSRCHVNWRWFFNTGGGLMSDWGVHMIDIVLLGMKESDPIEVHAVGGNFALDDDRDTPDTMQVVYKFPKWVMNWEVRFSNGRGLDGGRGHGSEFIGTKGTLISDRDGNQVFPEGEEDLKLPKRDQAGTDHWQNFLDCLRSREKPRSDIESMAKTTILCHLGNIAYQSGKPVRWDARNQDVVSRHEFAHCPSYMRAYRAPWELKQYPVEG